jgi:hypothetical protein
MTSRIRLDLALEHSDQFQEWQIADDRELADSIAQAVATVISAKYLHRVEASVIPSGGSVTSDPVERIEPTYIKIIY